MYKQIRYIMFITALINLILSIVLGKLLGISGIIFATSISKLSTYFWYEPNILFKKFFEISSKHYYLKHVENICVVVVSVLICYIPIHFIHTVSVFNWIIKAVIIGIVVNLIYFLIYRNNDSFKFLRDKVSGILKHK